ncbi:unnamed protein product [Musa hybrid cultivar]
MDHIISPQSLVLLSTLLCLFLGGRDCVTFVFVNKCEDTVWPGVLSNSGSPPLDATGFALPSGAYRTLLAPAGWSGRFWARTGCSFDGFGHGSCATGDCGSGQVECNGAGATPPATLVEFTLGGGTRGGEDYYDVSLVDGYNLPMTVEASREGCAATGCVEDLNRLCPPELRTGEGAACRSACDAFGRPEFCCSGQYSNPQTCRPSAYSELFKSACPQAYSYAFDDATSTFTCAEVQSYAITFCPVSTPSRKASKNPTGVVLQDDSWLASLAIGSANPTRRSVASVSAAAVTVVVTGFLFVSS